MPEAGPWVAEAGLQHAADVGPSGHQESFAPDLTVALDLELRIERRAVIRISFRLVLDGVQAFILH